MKKYKIITVILLGALMSAESQDIISGMGIKNLIKNVLENNPSIFVRCNRC